MPWVRCAFGIVCNCISDNWSMLSAWICKTLINIFGTLNCRRKLVGKAKTWDITDKVKQVSQENHYSEQNSPLPPSSKKMIWAVLEAQELVSKLWSTSINILSSATIYFSFADSRNGHLTWRPFQFAPLLPHCPGRPREINFMSRYICFSQNGPFDVCFEELFSKVQNPGGFFRKIVF